MNFVDKDETKVYILVHLDNPTVTKVLTTATIDISKDLPFFTN